MENKYKAYFYALAAAILLIALFRFDMAISRLITGLQTGFLTGILIIITSTAFQIFMLASATVLVYLKNKKKILALWLSVALATLFSVIIKIVIARQRPFAEGIPTVMSLVKDSYSKWDFSFPSNHAVFLFAMLPFIPKKFRIAWIVVSSIVALSRVYLGLHYLSDVFAGALLGLGTGYFVSKRLK